jgi:hypothetical protein
MSAANLKRFRMYVWAGGLLMAALYALLVLVLGGSDYDQAVAQHEWACQMIREGSWPKDPAIHCTEPLETLASNTFVR